MTRLFNFLYKKTSQLKRFPEKPQRKLIIWLSFSVLFVIVTGCLVFGVYGKSLLHTFLSFAVSVSPKSPQSVLVEAIDSQQKMNGYSYSASFTTIAPEITKLFGANKVEVDLTGTINTKDPQRQNSIQRITINKSFSEEVRTIHTDTYVMFSQLPQLVSVLLTEMNVPLETQNKLSLLNTWFTSENEQKPSDEMTQKLQLLSELAKHEKMTMTKEKLGAYDTFKIHFSPSKQSLDTVTNQNLPAIGEFSVFPLDTLTFDVWIDRQQSLIRKIAGTVAVKTAASQPAQREQLFTKLTRLALPQNKGIPFSFAMTFTNTGPPTAQLDTPVKAEPLSQFTNSLLGPFATESASTKPTFPHVELSTCTFSEDQTTGNSISIWRTSPDLTAHLSVQNPINFTNCTSDLPVITVDDTKTYQHMVGFGASMTDTSAYLLSRSANRNELMAQLFDYEKGIGISFLRQPIGASDFTVSSPYSYDDCPGNASDPEMHCFSIDHDKEYILPLLKQAKVINPNISFMATPWSPPAWMKTSHTMVGEGKDDKGSPGELPEDMYSAYAKYLATYLTSYQNEGIPISYLSIQNEPDVLFNYPGMWFPANKQKTFISSYLAPEFTSRGLTPQILVFDNSYFSQAPANLQDFKQQLSGVPMVSGTAVHCYGEFPGSNQIIGSIYETECSPPISQRYLPSFANPLTTTRMIMEAIMHGSRTITMWNIAEDLSNGPRPNNNSTGCSLCKPLVTISAGGAKFEADYYVLGHISKFVMPGAVRISATSADINGLQEIAFKNPDGTKVLIVFNNAPAVQFFQVKDHEKSFIYSISPRNILTFIW